MIFGNDAHNRSQADSLVRLLRGKPRLEAAPERLLALAAGVCNFDGVAAAAFQDQDVDPGAELLVLLQLIYRILNQIANNSIDLINSTGNPLQIVGNEIGRSHV